MVKKYIQIVPGYPLPLVQPFKEDYFAWPAVMMMKKGFDCEYVTLRNGRKAFEVFDGFPIKRFSSVFRLLWYLFRQDALIHAHLRPNAPSLFAGLLFNRKKVMTPFSYELGSNWLIEKVSLFLMKRFDRVIPISPYEAEVYLKHGFKKDKVTFIPLAIDYGLYSHPKKDAAVARKFGLEKKKFTFITLANFRYFKRVDVILEAFGEFRKRVPDSRLLIVGEDMLAQESKPTIREMVKSLGLIEGKDVILTGFQTADVVCRLFAYSDVYVNSSSVESQCLAAYEAAAAGIPLCLPRHRSFSDVYEDYVLYHSYDSPSQLAANMLRYYKDRKLVARNTAYVKKLVKDWDYEVVKRKMEKLYDEVLGN